MFQTYIDNIFYAWKVFLILLMVKNRNVLKPAGDNILKKEIIKIENIPAVLYGPDSDKIYLYVHGKHSYKEEAESFADVAVSRSYRVLSFDIPEHGEREGDSYKCSVQNGVHDLEVIYSYIKERYRDISLYACSLGACFSLMAYQNVVLSKSLFLSPILDMERLIRNMMIRADVTEEELKDKGEIETSFGETLSWDYYQYVKNHPIDKWDSNTFILYGGADNLTERSVLDSFAEKYNCDVDILEGGEHFFHTPEQLEYLERWIRRVTG